MYGFDKTSYGFRLKIWGDFSRNEIIQLRAELHSIFASNDDGFSIFVDTRETIALDQSALSALRELEAMVAELGAVRVAVIIKSPVVAGQARRVAVESGIASIERYIDASKTDHWEKLGLDWIIDSIEPDLNPIRQEDHIQPSI